VQVDFYIRPECDLMAVKRDTFRDMGGKLRSWRHSLKDALKIQPDDTPDTVKVRMGQNFINNYDPCDLEVLLDKWCDKKNMVSHELYYYFL
jgi:hypothetical protein